MKTQLEEGTCPQPGPPRGFQPGGDSGGQSRSGVVSAQPSEHWGDLSGDPGWREKMEKPLDERLLSL